MNEKQLDELERIAKAATPGPWFVHEKYPQWVTESGEQPRRHIYWPRKKKCTRYTLGNFDTEFGWGEATANAKFIAAVNPQTILELIADIRTRMKTETEAAEIIMRYRQKIDEIRNLAKW